MVPTRKGLQNLLQQLEATRAVLPANIPTAQDGSCISIFERSKMFQTYLGAARSKNSCTYDIFWMFCEHLAPSCGPWPASPTVRRPAFFLLLCNFLRRANGQFQKLANKFGGHVTMLQETVLFTVPFFLHLFFKILTVFKYPLLKHVKTC